MDKKLEPKVNILDGQNPGKESLLEREIPLQEQFIKQVKDDSLPADQVLTEQKEDRTPDDPPALFVP
jgi:hypothetical protein